MVGIISCLTRGINNPASHSKGPLLIFNDEGVEYAPAIWSPSTACLVDSLESVQIIVLWLIGLRLNWLMNLVCYHKAQKRCVTAGVMDHLEPVKRSF